MTLNMHLISGIIKEPVLSMLYRDLLSSVCVLRVATVEIDAKGVISLHDPLAIDEAAKAKVFTLIALGTYAYDTHKTYKKSVEHATLTEILSYWKERTVQSMIIYLSEKSGLLERVPTSSKFITLDIEKHEWLDCYDNSAKFEYHEYRMTLATGGITVKYITNTLGGTAFVTKLVQ